MVGIQPRRLFAYDRDEDSHRCLTSCEVDVMSPEGTSTNPRRRTNLLRKTEKLNTKINDLTRDVRALQGLVGKIVVILQIRLKAGDDVIILPGSQGTVPPVSQQKIDDFLGID